MTRVSLRVMWYPESTLASCIDFNGNDIRAIRHKYIYFPMYWFFKTFHSYKLTLYSVLSVTVHVFIVVRCEKMSISFWDCGAFINITHGILGKTVLWYRRLSHSRKASDLYCFHKNELYPIQCNVVDVLITFIKEKMDIKCVC